jgi:hypothetical protein
MPPRDRGRFRHAHPSNVLSPCNTCTKHSRAGCRARVPWSALRVARCGGGKHGGGRVPRGAPDLQATLAIVVPLRYQSLSPAKKFFLPAGVQARRPKETTHCHQGPRGCSGRARRNAPARRAGGGPSAQRAGLLCPRPGKAADPLADAPGQWRASKLQILAAMARPPAARQCRACPALLLQAALVCAAAAAASASADQAPVPAPAPAAGTFRLGCLMPLTGEKARPLGAAAPLAPTAGGLLRLRGLAAGQMPAAPAPSPSQRLLPSQRRPPTHPPTHTPRAPRGARSRPRSRWLSPARRPAACRPASRPSLPARTRSAAKWRRSSRRASWRAWASVRRAARGAARAVGRWARAGRRLAE